MNAIGQMARIIVSCKATRIMQTLVTMPCSAPRLKTLETDRLPESSWIIGGDCLTPTCLTYFPCYRLTHIVFIRNPERGGEPGLYCKTLHVV